MLFMFIYHKYFAKPKIFGLHKGRNENFDMVNGLCIFPEKHGALTY